MNDLQKEIAQIPHWFHSIDFGNGIYTSGDKSLELLAQELVDLQLPDLTGKTVLDIGTWEWKIIDINIRCALCTINNRRFIDGIYLMSVPMGLRNLFGKFLAALA